MANSFQEKMKSIKEELASVGIASRFNFTHGPRSDTNGFVFELSSSRKGIRFTLGSTYKKTADAQLPVVKIVSKSKDFRQALLYIEEPAHSITEEIRIPNTPRYKDPLYWKQECLRYAMEQLSDIFPVEVRDSLVGEIQNIKEFEQQLRDKSNINTIIMMKVKLTVPHSDQHILTGYDEQHMFICRLPRPASSVKEAHEILLPDEVKALSAKERKDVKRQGEFFFIPVTEQQELVHVLKALSELCVEGDRLGLIGNEGIWFWEPELERSNSLAAQWVGVATESDHDAELGIVTHNHLISPKDYRFNKKNLRQYVYGDVKHSRHKTLKLDNWHRVVHNNEVINTNDKWD